MFSLPNLPYLKDKDPRLYETLVTLHNNIQDLAKQAGLATSGRLVPPAIQNFVVSAANGIFAAAITDSSDNHLGINYFIEYADNANFNNFKTKYLGPARNIDGWYLGNVTLYFRAFSQYQNSDPSPRVNYGGSTPTAVSGGGSAPPTSLPTQGSGSGFGGGFGGSKTPRISTR